MRFPKTRKTAYSLLEAVLSLICIAVLMASIFASIEFNAYSSAQQKTLVSMDSVAVCITEAVTADLHDGIDIIEHDYDNDDRIKSDRIAYETFVDFADDVFGATLYQIEIKMVDHAIGTAKTVKVFVVGEEA